MKFILTVLLLFLLHSKAHSAITQEHENIDLGVLFVNADTQETLLQKNADRGFLPASDMKLFIAVAALKQLGSDFTYQTTLEKSGNDYYLKLSGDPSFTAQDLYALLAHIKQKTIDGNIIIDNTIFDNQPLARGTTWDELNICYSAPTSGVIIDENCTRFHLSATKLGKPATIDKTLPITLENTVMTSTKPGCDLNLEASKKNVYQLSGCLAPNKKLPFAVSIKNPSLYAISLVEKYLQEHHITLNGKVVLGKTPKDAIQIASHQSKAFAELLAHMLKTSDSLYANAFLKTLGHVYFHQQGSWFNGIQATQKILTKAGIDLSHTKMFDASGQSRYNSTTPNTLVQLLVYAYADKSIWPTFKNALAIANTDGTLKHRMPELKGDVFAKTGTFHNTSTLAGYLYNKQGDVIAFSIMINGGMQDVSKYWQVESTILDTEDAR